MQTVEAIKSKQQIEAIKALLSQYGKSDLYSDIWSVGINMALRISDLLSLKYSDLDGDSFKLIEGKTKKAREIAISPTVRAIVTRRKKANPDDVYLFQVHSNRASGKPVSRESVARMFKEVGDKLGVKLGTHSMRKTRGYFMFKNGASLELISKLLNHSSTASTLRYIGIEAEDIQATYDMEL